MEILSYTINKKNYKRKIKFKYIYVLLNKINRNPSRICSVLISFFFFSSFLPQYDASIYIYEDEVYKYISTYTEIYLYKCIYTQKEDDLCTGFFCTRLNILWHAIGCSIEFKMSCQVSEIIKKKIYKNDKKKIIQSNFELFT